LLYGLINNLVGLWENSLVKLNMTHVYNQNNYHMKQINCVMMTTCISCVHHHTLVVFFSPAPSAISYLSMFLIWLCNAKKDTGESIASRLLAHRRTTFSPVWWIFSVNWSTAILLGAQTNTGLEKS